MRLNWKVGLSDGSNYIEGDKTFPIVAGENSPWLKLKAYLLQNDLQITSLCLVCGDRTFNLPSAGKNPKFSAFLNAPKPIYYKFGRVIGGFIGKNNDDLFVRIEAVYESYTLQLWVDENNPNLCYALVI